MTRRGPLVLWLAGCLLLLAGCSIYLGLHRIYQVDECQNLYMAMVAATGQASEFFTTGSLFLLGPLSWICRNCTSSEAIFAWARMFYVGIFWLNLVLLAGIASRRLWSIRGLIALALAATLAPLWDYGFEVRHDNLILTCVLLTWWAVRVQPRGACSYLIAGALCITALFIAVKSVVYVLPLSAAFLAFPPPGLNRPRWQLALNWAAGAALGGVFIRLCYGTSGMWQVYLDVFHGVTKFSVETTRSKHIWPWITLQRLLTQTPLLLALIIAAFAGVISDLWHRTRAAVTWQTNLPELLLVLGAFTALLVNPTPFPYNLVHFVPYAFLLVFRYGDDLLEKIKETKGVPAFVAALLIFGHLAPFALVTRRHLDFGNERQKVLMNLAEGFTDSRVDPVYDGIGMVLTRPSIHARWYLHSLNIREFTTGPGPRVRDMLAARPAAVFIPNYRTDALTKEDHAFVRKHYVPLADDFWVLGSVLPAAGGMFEIIHAGRYWIGSARLADLSKAEGCPLNNDLKEDGPSAGSLDGTPLSGRIVELAVGSHQIQTESDRRSAIVWLGPHLNRLPELSVGSHRDLFVNWY